MKEPVYSELGMKQQLILQHSRVAPQDFDALPAANRAAYFGITSALVLRANLPVANLELLGGTGGITDDRLFFQFDQGFVNQVEADTDKGRKTFKTDTYPLHGGIKKAVRQTTTFGSLQIGWAPGVKMEVDIDVGNPQKPLGFVVHAAELANNKVFGKIGKFFRIPGAKDKTDHTVLRKLFHARAV